MKKVRQKKFIGAAIGLVGSLAASAINANSQKRMMDAQLAAQERQMNRQEHLQDMAYKNALLNQDMSAHYDKFNPIFKMGGKRVKKCKLGTFKDRF